jgi:iron complex transport system ATP-binding protein
MSSIISVEQAAFDYGTGQVFAGVSFGVAIGEVLCLLGSNGSGKTTLLECILGIKRLGAGEIRIDGKNTARLGAREIARSMAYVPQRHETVFPYAVLDIVTMGRAPYIPFFGTPSAADLRYAEEALQAAGIGHLKDRPYTQISGGEAQLVMIARALAQKARVLIMDEPTAHLDFRNELMVLETIARLVVEQGVALIMATHSPNHAFHFEGRGIETRVALLHQGQLAAQGTPRKVLSEHTLRESYGVETSVVSFDQGRLAGQSYVIPVGTTGRNGNRK